MMRRHFSGRSFHRALRNKLNFSTDSTASNGSSDAPKTKGEIMKQNALMRCRQFYRCELGDEFFCSIDANFWEKTEELLKETEELLEEKNFERECLSDRLRSNPTIASLTEAARTKRDAAANAAKDAASAQAALRRAYFERWAGATSGLFGHDELIPGVTVNEAQEAAHAARNARKKIWLQESLTQIQKIFEEIELKKNPNDCEKQPWALPNVEIETNRIADLLVEESLIIFVAAFFWGEKGQQTGISSHAAIYTDNKGLPLKVLLGRNLNGSKRKAGPYALECSVEDAEKTFTSVRCRIFSDDKPAVKRVQERMRKLKAREVVPKDRLTFIAKDIIRNDSTIEFIASERNLMAGFLAQIIAKIGHPFLDASLPSDEAEIILA